MHGSSEWTVVVDSREQFPYEFPRAIVKALPAGDYAVLGLEERAAVERKTQTDAYSSLGGGRARFEREVERLSKYDFAAIVVECSLPEFLNPPPFSRLHPRSAIGTLLAWNVKYGVSVIFAGDRAHGEAVTWKLLEKFACYAREERLERE